MKTFEEYRFTIRHNNVKISDNIEWDDSYECDNEYTNEVKAVAKYFNVAPKHLQKDDSYDAYILDDAGLEHIEEIDDYIKRVYNKHRCFYSLKDDEAEKRAKDEFYDTIPSNVTDYFDERQSYKCLTSDSYDFLKDYIADGFRCYAEDKYTEEADNDKYENALVEEMYDNKMLKDNDFKIDANGNVDFSHCSINKTDLIDTYAYNMTDDYETNDEIVDYIIDNYGKSEIRKLLKRKKIEYDFDALWEEWVDKNSPYSFFDTDIDLVSIDDKEYVVLGID